jgi:hypothetical protein
MERRMSGRHHNADHYDWHVDGFVPAPVGWRIVCLDEQGTLHLYPLPGWLIQEEVAYDQTGSYPEAEGFQSSRPIRRAVAATHVWGELVPVHDGVADFWRIAAPYDLQPTPQEIRTELERRKKIERAVQLAE